MTESRFVPLAFVPLSPAQSLERARAFEAEMCRRRSVRDFSPEPVDREVIESAIRTAASAPSGANQQPWTFVAISDPALKAEIRVAAEQEEKAVLRGPRRLPNGSRRSARWAPTGTSRFSKRRPWLIAIFQQRWGEGPDGQRIKHYYAPESVGIATGFLIAALHRAGLATLTHTPSPMGFLNAICGRPDNEKPVILLVVGKPAPDCRVPAIAKKPLAEVARFL